MRSCRLLWPLASLLVFGCGGELSEDDQDATALTEELTITATSGVAKYGTSVRGRELTYHRIRPSNANGKKALLTFALHGFEDAWRQDGRALATIAHDLINAYKTSPASLKGWTLYVVPSANPDGMKAGVNNFREGTANAFGRCNARGRDINRNFSTADFPEHNALKALVNQIDPSFIADFHGWYNCYYGSSRVGDFFARAFNSDYAGKPARYCFVKSTGGMDCGSALGGVFHKNTSISHDLFAEWAMSHRNIPSAIIEYPAPDFNLNGSYDTTYDSSLGVRVLSDSTRAILTARTRLALNNLFTNF